MKGPLTPAEYAARLSLHPNVITRFIAAGELDAVIHPEAAEAFENSKSTVSPYTGPTAAVMREELDGCDVVLLAQYMQGEGGAGSFFAAIARALPLADPGNLRSLYAAFPDTLHGYLVRQRAWAEGKGWAKA